MIKTKLLVGIITLLIITTTGLTTAYASHGGSASGGGSCGNCTPPTLGVDKDGITRVNGGISINSIAFDVDLYSQKIPVQILNQGEKTSIVLKIFEDQGMDSVAYAELHFGPYDKMISGILVEHSMAHLMWHNEYGDEIIGIYDDDEIFQNVVITANNLDRLKIITFEFEPTTVMDKTTFMNRVWDERKNVVNNYFTDAIKIVDVDSSKSMKEDKIQPEIPTWIKKNAGWWAEGKIDDVSFLGGVGFMIKENVISISEEYTENDYDKKDSHIPDWVRQTSKWWSDDLISDGDFVKSLEFLINNKMISI
ncbi:MAG: hypothetical protein OER82_11950 [Nitrosopumilus sp.]|nr:hypothetical protein [Nitrosopumilus sp.]